MGYHIEYRSDRRNKTNSFGNFRLIVLTFISIGIFLCMVSTMWPEGEALIQRSIPFCRDAITISALNNFAEELKFGEKFIAAFSGFWSDLVS